MKVIAKVKERKYICEIGHTELEKFFDRYYNSNQFNILCVGQEVDLGKGYDFRADIRDAMRTTQEFIEGHEKIANTILNGLKYL